MAAFLKAVDLTEEQFLDLIKNLQLDTASDLCYIWLEAPDGWALDRWNDDGELRWYGAGRESIKKSAQDCLRCSIAGRLFAPTGELRWRIIPSLGQSCWRVVFLGNVDWVGPVLEDHSDTLNALHSHQESFLLWGQQTPETPDEWIELRIPHRFRYPITGNPERVKVVVEQWDDNAGAPHFVRLCGLEAFEGEK